MKKPWPSEKAKSRYKDLQRRLQKRLVIKDINGEFKTLLAVDVSYRKGQAFACGVLWNIAKACPFAVYKYAEENKYPYISGLFFIRELPPIVHLIKSYNIEFDLLLLNAAGIAHPEGIGLACHAGLYFKRPSFGITERIPSGFYTLPERNKGSHSEISNDEGKVLGYVLRSQDHVKPIFVTPGHLITAESALNITLSLPFKARLPEPLRIADRCSTKEFKKEIKIWGCEDKTIYPVQHTSMSREEV